VLGFRRGASRARVFFFFFFLKLNVLDFICILPSAGNQYLIISTNKCNATATNIRLHVTLYRNS